jgi:AraC-like DNA-binding protein
MQPISGRGVSWEDAYQFIEPKINACSVHEWQFRPEFPIDVRFLRFRAKRSIRMNRHDYFEILYLASGEASYQVQDRLFPMQPGDLFLVGSTLMHHMSQYRTPELRAAVLYFMPDLIRGAGQGSDEMEYLMPFLVQDSGFCHVIKASSGLPAQVFELMKRAHSDLPAASQRARLSVKTYLKMILVLLVNHFSEYRGSEATFELQQRNLERAEPLFEWIDTHYESHITVEDAAALLHMSRSNFMRFFKQTTGQSFVGYLNCFRIAKAEVLLATTDLSIAEVSHQVGFCDQSYFGLVFRNLLQVTPREYKQAAAKAS